MDTSKQHDSGDSSAYSDGITRTGAGWGFEERPLDDKPYETRHKTGSLSFQNALLGLKKDQQRVFEEEKEEEEMNIRSPTAPHGEDTGNRLHDIFDPPDKNQTDVRPRGAKTTKRGQKEVAKRKATKSKSDESKENATSLLKHQADEIGQGPDTTRLKPSSGNARDGDSPYCNDIATEDGYSSPGSGHSRTTTASLHESSVESTKPPRVPGLAPHPPNAPSPKPTRRPSRTRRPDFINTSKHVPENHVSKSKLNLSVRETSNKEESELSPLPKLREARRPQSYGNYINKTTGNVSAPPVSSPKLSRRKSLGTMSPVPVRRRSVYDEPVAISGDNHNAQIRRLQAGTSTHSSFPLPSTSNPGRPNVRRFSSVNLPPIAGPNQRRHSSVVTPAPSSLTLGQSEPRHTVSSSTGVLAQTFGGKNAISMARQRRFSQAVDELLHIEEVRRASEMRNIVTSSQPGLAGKDSQSRDLGDMLQGLKNCRYLRGSMDDEEFV